MALDDTLRHTLCDKVAPATRRQRRADRTRARAFSPLRILLALMSIPVLATSLTVAIFIRTSPFDAPVALAHLIALGGCDAAASVGMAPAREGAPGYHPRNDPDGDGVACGSVSPQLLPKLQAQPGDAAATVRMNGGAKFLRP